MRDKLDVIDDQFFGIEGLIPEIDDSEFHVSDSSKATFENNVSELYAKIKDDLSDMKYHVNKDKSKVFSNYDNKEINLIYTIDNLDKRKDDLLQDSELSKMLSKYDVIKHVKDNELLIDKKRKSASCPSQFSNLSKKDNYLILSKNIGDTRYNILLQSSSKKPIKYDPNQGVADMMAFEDEIAKNDYKMPFGYTHQKVPPTMKL